MNTAKTYYVVSCEVLEKKHGALIWSPVNDIRWLTLMYGFADINSDKEWAHRNPIRSGAEPPTIEWLMQHWDGQPSHYRIKPGSIQIYKVTESRTYEEV